jgi:hypothetical protein
MSWLRRIIAGAFEIRRRARGVGFPGAPDSIPRGGHHAPLGDPLKFRKTYYGK